MTRCVWISIIGLVVATVTLIALLWFGPTGIGEVVDSPDGQYTASAMNMCHGTVLLKRVEYIELQVIESASGQVIWSAMYHHPVAANVPDYGDRSHNPFIVWSGDSTSVTIPVGPDKLVTIPVP